MKGKRTIAYIEKLCREKGLSYLDVRLYKGYERLFSYGVAKDGAPTGNEKLYLFSATKPMTVICAMRLVEEGKLGLDDWVETYLPAYKDTFVLDKNGKATPTKNKMTVRHLLTMSGGLTYDVQTEPLQALLKEKKNPTTEECVNTFIKTPLSFEPGERFQYSLCHDVLAAVIEKASGKRFSTYMDEIVFQPLGMKGSGFHTEGNGVYDMWDCNTDGDVWKIKPHNRLILGEKYDSGGAGAISTLDDYTKFAVALANDGAMENGYRLLKKTTLKEVRSICNENMQVSNSFTCVQGDEYGYGLGVRVRAKDTPWGLKQGEYGWDGAAGTYLMIDPHNKIALTVGMHLLSWPYVFRGEHLKIAQFLYEEMKEEGLL